MQILKKNKDLELAKEIFKSWDTLDRGYISVDELSEKLIGLDLSNNSKFASRLLMTIGGGTDILTLKDFLKICK